jgi:hypothetical protein
MQICPVQCTVYIILVHSSGRQVSNLNTGTEQIVLVHITCTMYRYILDRAPVFKAISKILPRERDINRAKAMNIDQLYVRW